jgi:ATP adenylyltransferase
LLNRYPYNNGHLLVAPQLHRARLDQLCSEEQIDLFREIIAMVALLEKVLHPQGFNVGLNLGPAAGAGLPGHLHGHIVPRWHGDTNFMPAVAAVKVIPQALDSLWAALTQALSAEA